MKNLRNITKDVFYIGDSDRRLAKFENLFPIPNGVSYNSYFIDDEKTAVVDTVDTAVLEIFLENIQDLLSGRSLDYLIINHMEPDHTSGIIRLLQKYPDMKIVTNAKALTMINQFFNYDLTSNAIIVVDNSEFSVGTHTLKFIFAPMVHWPEVMVCYDLKDKILFSADAFGTFGALSGNIFDDELNFNQVFLDEARRYYCNIVGKYGTQVKTLLKKAASLYIKIICPLHGVIFRHDLSTLVEKYLLWADNKAEIQSVLIVYGSIYGNTAKVAQMAATELASKGVKNIKVCDVSSTDVSYLVADVFKYSHILLACPTYNGNIFPPMHNFLNDVKMLLVQNKKFAVIDNGTWASVSGKMIVKHFEEMKNMTLIGKPFSLKSAFKVEQLTEFSQLMTEIFADVTSSSKLER